MTHDDWMTAGVVLGGLLLWRGLLRLDREKKDRWP